MSASAALAALALCWLLTEIPGWAVMRAARVRADRFTRLWAGMVVTSIAGLALAQAGRFSLPTLLGALGVVTLVCLLLARRAPLPGAPEPHSHDGCAALAALAALAAFCWSWPPYDTVIAAADSTMYVSAGIHLARSGSIWVADSVVPLLPRDVSTVLFTALGRLGSGPFVRLPGGLMMPSLEAPSAILAFFPLLPVWIGILTLGGGVAAGVLVAPLFTALGVWAVVLFTGESLGFVAAAGTAVALLANFGVWWFARFAMPEPLAMAAIWAGLAVLRRAAVAEDRRLAFLAGAIFGLAGLARTETFLFLIAAGALAWAWGRPRLPMPPLLAGFALLVGVALLNGENTPSHHLAYLENDLAMHYGAAYLWATRTDALGSLRAGAALAATGLAVLLLAAGFLGRRTGVGVVRGVLRLAVPLALVAVLALYVRVALVVLPWRDTSWLAAYCSWPLLALAALGVPLAWQRGGAAMRVAGWAWLLATAVFVLNPRVAPYQPWAIRRFLPLVIPGIAVAGGAALAWIAQQPYRGARKVALALTVLVVALEGRPVLTTRALPYYSGNLAAVEAIAERLPADAIVAMDSGFADIQLQVPLWLITGRETLLVSEGGQRWQDVMHGLLGSGRPVIWIANHVGSPRDVGDVQLQPLEPDAQLAVAVPDAPADTPPGHTVTRLVPLRIYSVSALMALETEPVTATAARRGPSSGCSPHV